jgi:transposase
LEVVKGEKNIAHIASESGVHPNQIRQWRQHLLDILPEVFSNRRPQEEKSRGDMEAELYRQIGQFKVELDWLKNISVASVKLKRTEIESRHPMIPIVRQCEL